MLECPIITLMRHLLSVFANNVDKGKKDYSEKQYGTRTDKTSFCSVNGLYIQYPLLLNSQSRIIHFAYSDWFTQSWLSAHIPWFDLIW